MDKIGAPFGNKYASKSYVGKGPTQRNGPIKPKPIHPNIKSAMLTTLNIQRDQALRKYGVDVIKRSPVKSVVAGTIISPFALGFGLAGKSFAPADKPKSRLGKVADNLLLGTMGIAEQSISEGRIASENKALNSYKALKQVDAKIAKVEALPIIGGR